MDSPGKQRLSRIQRKEVEDTILNCKLSRMSVQDTQRTISEKLNIHLSESWITHIRMKFKRKCQDDIKRMGLDRYEFISHYMERIAEVRNLQQKFWEEWNKINDPISRINCLREAREQTVLLTDLIEHLPSISQVDVTQTQRFEAHFSSGSSSNKDEDQPPTRF
jgi:hypothetical protein